MNQHRGRGVIWWREKTGKTRGSMNELICNLIIISQKNLNMFSKLPYSRLCGQYRIKGKGQVVQ